MTSMLDRRSISPSADRAAAAGHATETASGVPRWFALGAVAGPAVFTLAWFVLGFLDPVMVFAGSPPISASAVTAPISGLGLGPTDPFMNAAFVRAGCSRSSS